EFGIEDGGVPGFLAPSARRFAGVRYDIDWDTLDYVRHFDRVRVPVLLLHGTADKLVPEDISERLVQQRSDLVTLVRVPGAGHVRAWNVDPAAYERAVREFLAKVAP